MCLPVFLCFCFKNLFNKVGLTKPWVTWSGSILHVLGTYFNTLSMPLFGKLMEKRDHFNFIWCVLGYQRVFIQFTLTNYNILWDPRINFKICDTEVFELMLIWINRFPCRKEAVMSWVFGK